MGHRIYTGSFAALEARWIATVSELRREDPFGEISVLVGSNLLAHYLAGRYAAEAGPAGNVRFYTFLDLARRLAAASGAPVDRPRMPALGPAFILENALERRTPEVFRPLAGLPGFQDALLETFRDLRDAEIAPGRIPQAVPAQQEMRERRLRLEALADLYGRCRRESATFYDVDDAFRAATAGCSRASGVLGLRRLLVYGVYDATGQQARLLGAAGGALDMAYFIPGTEASAFAESFVRARAGELGVEPEPLAGKAPESSLQRLAARAFGLAPDAGPREGGPMADDGSVALVSAPGESRMALEVVREVVRAFGDGSIRGFQEAAVIVRQPEADAPMLEEALRLRGIPCCVHGGRRFADSLLARAVAALLRLEPDGFPHEGILSAMELVAASLPEAEASGWDVDSWRALTCDPRFLAGARAWDAGIEAAAAGAGREVERASGENAEDAGDDGEGDRRPTREEAERRQGAIENLRARWRLLRGASAGWPRELGWGQWAEFLAGRLEPLLGASEDWPVFASVLDAVGALGALSPRSVPQEALRGALDRALRSLSLPEGRSGPTGVHILSAAAARGLRFPLVIVPGLDEGRFPAHLRQDPLLLDTERSRLAPLPLKKMRLDEERLLFDMAARSAGKRLVLMTSRLDEASDRERIPSQFFLRAAAAVRGGELGMRELAADTVPGFRSVSLDEPAPAPGLAAIDGGEVRLRLVTSAACGPSRALEALARREPERLAGPLAYAGARFVRGLTPYDGLIQKPGLVRHMAETLWSHGRQVSASRLESYARCPYAYFLRYGMGLEAWEEPEPADAVDPLERGKAVHEILERFLGGRPDLRGESEERLRGAIDTLARGVLERFRPAGIADLLWEIERDGILGMLGNWIAFERERAAEGLAPARFELVFGRFPGEEGSPPYRVTAGRHRFDFRGRIDRVDRSADGRRARVVDYKTGALPPTLASRSRTPLMGGEKIQLALYRGALSVLEEFRSAAEVEGEYLHLGYRDGKIAPAAFGAEELDAAAGVLPRILEILGDGIASGLFFARPGGTVWPSGHCDYCDYLPVCGPDRASRQERKAEDPRVRRFFTITELEA